MLVAPLAGAALLAPSVATAHASELIGRDVHAVRLVVGTRGVARIDYTTAGGQVVHVLAWGAVNANAPSRTVRQRRFQLNFAGGYHSVWGTNYWRKMRNHCTAYHGPALINLVAACRAPDGSYWAIQTWLRLAPNGGWARPRPATELQLSHWTGAIPALTLYQNWERSNHAVDRVFGQFTYDGAGVYGFTSTTTGNPTDGYGRNVYVDVERPLWYRTAWSIGASWYRFNSGLSHHIGVGALLPSGQHAAGGDFCLGMWPLYGRTLAADGVAYRATALGPGVTPVVRAGPIRMVSYSSSAQSRAIALEQTFTPAADPCHTGGQ